MTIALALLAYAMVLALVAPRVLVRGWADRAPRTAIAAWQAVTMSVVYAVVLAAVAPAVPATRISAGVAEVLRACVMTLHAHYASPGGVATAGAGLFVALGVAGRTRRPRWPRQG